jgi:asparagine synthase (glutamine-hydrolysing)
VTHTVRCVGIRDARAPVIDAFTERATARGLRVERADGVAVAHHGSPVARADDGSFLVLDGESFPVGPPDAMARRVLDAVRAGATSAPFEGMATWWDAPRSTVVALGDPVGAVPVAWGRVGSTVVWSSDHRDLLAAGVAPVPDPDAIALLAALGWVPAPITYLRAASALPAGRALVLADGAEPRVAPWFLHSAEPATDGDADAQADAVGAALVRAVEDRSGGGRLGAFLSAGIDSTAIVTVLRRVLDVDVDTFTFRYLGYEGEHNEDVFAAGTARLLGASHTTIEVSPADLRERFASIVAAFGSPVSFGVHSFKQDVVRDAGIGVVLTGADPGGWYPYGRGSVVASLLWRLPVGVRLAVQRLTPEGTAPHWLALLANHAIKNEYTTLEWRRELVGGAADRAARRYSAALADLARDTAAERREHRATFVSETVGLYDAEWNTRWGRAFGYPIRAAFYDPSLALAIDRRRPWDEGKAPLRRYVARLVPDEQAYAPKIYQEVPLAQWLRGPLRDFVRDALSRERVETSGTMAYEPVRRLVEEHESGIDRKWPLWQLMTAVEWGLQLRAADVGAPLLAPPR